MQWLLGDKLAFINVNEEMLKSELLELMPPKRTVLEILKSITPSDEIVERCQALRSQGYRVALDNPHLCEGSERLLPCADYVKINIQSVDLAELGKIFMRFNASSIKMIAEKVETEKQFEACKHAGFQLFQG